MQNVSVFGLMLLFLGVVLIALGIAKGEVTVALVVILPIVIGSGVSAGLGVLCLMIGMMMLFLGGPSKIGRETVSDSSVHYSSEHRSVDDESKEIKRVGMKGGGVVFIGPIPLVFGSDTKITKSMLLAGIILTIICIVCSLILSM